MACEAARPKKAKGERFSNLILNSNIRSVGKRVLAERGSCRCETVSVQGSEFIMNQEARDLVVIRTGAGMKDST